MYIDRELPDPYLGDWVEDHCGDAIPEHPATDTLMASSSEAGRSQ